MIEFDAWGWNLMTFGFVGINAMLFVRAWGHWHQIRRIWTERSGRSLSVHGFIYGAGTSCCTIAYGSTIHSFTMIFGSSMSLLFAMPILVGLWRFKGFGRSGYAIIAGIFGLVLAILYLPFKDMWYMTSTLGLLVSVWLTPIEMFRNKDAGVVEVRMIIAQFLTSCFWTCYGIAIGNWVILTLNPNFLASGAAKFLLWSRYRRRTPVVPHIAV